MRSSAGIVAALLAIGLVANCGGNDSNGGGPNGGSTNDAGQGGAGAGKGATGGGGTTTTAGTAGAPGEAGQAGQAGMPPMLECTKDKDCGANATCIENVCKKDDGEACTADAECANACIDKVCTAKLPDDAACTSDADCAHTCIDNVCKPVSDVGGDCDVDLGTGGAGGAGGAGSGGIASVSSAGAGGAAEVPQNPDCTAPLQCVAGKCLTPDGEACKDNVDCVSQACVNSVCTEKGGIDAACDDTADCAVAGLVCDPATNKCKLAVKEKCVDNGQCQSNNCICSDAKCLTRACKNPNATCLCRWSPVDSATCTVQSAPLDSKTEDPNGCDASTSNYCNGGQCVPAAAGNCAMPCVVNDNGTPNDTSDDKCILQSAPTGCSAGYHSTQTAACAFTKGVCSGTCQCDLN